MHHSSARIVQSSCGEKGKELAAMCRSLGREDIFAGLHEVGQSRDIICGNYKTGGTTVLWYNNISCSLCFQHYAFQEQTIWL